jgi:hypothetical protein
MTLPLVNLYHTQQTPTLEVTPAGPYSCTVGAVVTLTAAATTGIAAVDTPGYTYTWTLATGDTSTFTSSNGVLSYTCKTVGPHDVTVTAVTKGAFAAKLAAATHSIAVAAPINTKLEFGHVTLEHTGVPGIEVQVTEVGKSLTLTVPFTHTSKTNTYSIIVDWGDAKYVVGDITTDPLTRSFTLEHAYTKLPKAGTAFLVQIIVFDNSGKPQIIDTTKAIEVTGLVSEHIIDESCTADMFANIV